MNQEVEKMKGSKEAKFVDVLYGSQWETSLVKSILESDDITVYVKNEITATLNSFNASSMASTNPTIIIVSSFRL